MDTQNPPAAVSITTRPTRTGTVLLVRVRTPGRVAWRTYTHTPGCDLDKAMAAALRSCGQASAWAWGRLL